MLREEVLRGWESCKTKLTTVRLTPQDKEVYKFMSGNKTGMFSYHCVDSRTSLEQLEKEIKVEWEKYLSLDTENEMLFSYWFCWSKFASLILDWIELKKLIDYYRSLDPFSQFAMQYDDIEVKDVLVVVSDGRNTSDLATSIRAWCPSLRTFTNPNLEEVE